MKKLLFGLMLFLLTSCNGSPTPVVVSAPTVEVTPTVMSTVSDGDKLSICILGEPNSLYAYDPLNISAQKTLSIIYDGLLPAPNKLFKPSILIELPTFDNGQTIIAPILAKQGDTVMTADAKVKPLHPGDLVLPTRCRDINCAVVFTGEPIEMDQIMITFEFINDLRWSDGELLTVDDSLFSYELAKRSLSTSVTDHTQRTRSYEKTGDFTIQWWGIPGYLWAEPSAVFFPPLPEHLMGGIDISNFEKNALSDQYLLGWGAYKFESWDDGDMVLAQNEYFYDPLDRSPAFKQLTLKYFGNTAEIVAAFDKGICDIVDNSAGLESMIPVLARMNKDQEVNLRVETSPVVEKLIFNTREDHIGGTKDINPLANAMTRAGLSACIDRYSLINYDLQGFPSIADSLIYPVGIEQPDNENRFEFSLPVAKEYLERSGWNDDDHDPRTPRVSKKIEGLPDGTKLKLVYATTNSSLRTGMADVITRMFNDCGVEVEVQTYSPDRFFEASANGILSSGNFDIAQFASGSFETAPQCAAFMSDQIPSSDNGWQGTNFGGYNNLDLDTVCHNANYTRSKENRWMETLRVAHEITVFDSIAVPLFNEFSVTIAKPDICLPTAELMDQLGTFNIVDIKRGPNCYSLRP